jgi:hypothetical protein
MPDQNERFYIAPVEGKAPPESIVIGPMDEVMRYIRQSIPRMEEEKRLARAQLDAEQTAQQQAETRACAAQMLADGITRLGVRIDAYETRKAERADQQRRADEEAEAKEAEEYLASLPDPDQPEAFEHPDDPHATGDDGDFEAVKPPPDTEKHDPEHRNEAATGAMPNELDKGAPPQPGEYVPTTPAPSPYRDPTAIGGV